MGLLSSCPAASPSRDGDLSSPDPPTRCIRMNSYPADELRISEVERGLSTHAVLRLAPGSEPAAGDSILFAQALSSPGQEPRFLIGGDSVRVVPLMGACERMSLTRGHNLIQFDSQRRRNMQS